jgi:hypothetical protein
MKPSIFYSLFIACIFFFNYAKAQHTHVIYYDNSKQIYSKEEWNKANTMAHFTIYFKNGKIKAEGYKKYDRYRRHAVPCKSFKAFNEAGLQIQQMLSKPDSTRVITYDDSGKLRNYIIIYKNLCSETSYYPNGYKKSFTQCFIPDSLSYFKDYYYPDTRAKKNYTIKLYPRLLWPIGYGVAGNDGISASGTFKIYFSPDCEEPHCVSKGCGVMFDSFGNISNINPIPYF